MQQVINIIINFALSFIIHYEANNPHTNIIYRSNGSNSCHSKLRNVQFSILSYFTESHSNHFDRNKLIHIGNNYCCAPCSVLSSKFSGASALAILSGATSSVTCSIRMFLSRSCNLIFRSV